MSSDSGTEIPDEHSPPPSSSAWSSPSSISVPLSSSEAQSRATTPQLERPQVVTREEKDQTVHRTLVRGKVSTHQLVPKDGLYPSNMLKEMFHNYHEIEVEKWMSTFANVSTQAEYLTLDDLGKKLNHTSKLGGLGDCSTELQMYPTLVRFPTALRLATLIPIHYYLTVRGI